MDKMEYKNKTLDKNEVEDLLNTINEIDKFIQDFKDDFYEGNI